MAQKVHASFAPCTQGRSVETGADGIPDRQSCAARTTGCRRGCFHCDVRHIALCAALREDELPYLESIVSSVSLAPGRALFRQGDPVRHVYNVAAGTVRLFKLLPDGRRQITGFGMAGGFVGLTADGTHPYGAEAVDRVELCRLPIRRLQELVARFPEVEHRLRDMQAAELVAAQDRMVLGRKTPLEKIASFLLEVSERQKGRGQPASPIVLRMTRGDIADYLGLTVETVSRCFTRLKGDRCIALPEPTSVALLDRERLQDLASGD